MTKLLILSKLSLMGNEQLVDLEIKISHQEIAIEELKQTSYEQHLTIERLEKELKRLNDRLDGAISPSPIGPGNEKPPHY